MTAAAFLAAWEVLLVAGVVLGVLAIGMLAFAVAILLLGVWE